MPFQVCTNWGLVIYEVQFSWGPKFKLIMEMPLYLTRTCFVTRRFSFVPINVHCVQGTIVVDCTVTNKTDHHDIAEILLKVAINTISLTPIVFKYWKIKTPRLRQFPCLTRAIIWSKKGGIALARPLTQITPIYLRRCTLRYPMMERGLFTASHYINRSYY
jgi:hypothetical protein